MSPNQYKRVCEEAVSCYKCLFGVLAFLSSHLHSLAWLRAVWDTCPNTCVCDLEYVCELYLFCCLGAFPFPPPPLFQPLSLFRTALHLLLLRLIPDFFGSPQHLSFIQEKGSPFSATSLHKAAYLSFYWRQNKTSKTLKKLEHPFSPFQLTPTNVYLGSNLRFIWNM